MSYNFKLGDLVIIKQSSKFFDQNYIKGDGVIAPRIINEVNYIDPDDNDFAYIATCTATNNRNSYRRIDLELFHSIKFRYKKKKKNNLIVGFDELPKSLEILANDSFSKILPNLKKEIGKVIIKKKLNEAFLDKSKKIICYEVTPKEYLIICTKLYSDKYLPSSRKYIEYTALSSFHNIKYFKKC
jgi:hypothetical protein